MAHATRAGEARLASSGAAGYATVALRGPMPAADVRHRCETLLAEVSGDRQAEAVISGVLAQLYAMSGDFEGARELYRAGRRMLDELGVSVTAATTSTESARVELLAGDPAAAEAELRSDHDVLEAMDERYFRSTVAATLALVLIEQDRFEEADGYARSAEELTEADDVSSEVLWRSARARILARSGEADHARRMASRAVELADETVDLILQGDAYVVLATVLDETGDAADAEEARAAALERYERKGDRVSADRLRDRSAREVAGASAATSSP